MVSWVDIPGAAVEALLEANLNEMNKSTNLRKGAKSCELPKLPYTLPMDDETAEIELVSLPSQVSKVNEIDISFQLEQNLNKTRQMSKRMICACWLMVRHSFHGYLPDQPYLTVSIQD